MCKVIWGLSFLINIRRMISEKITSIANYVLHMFTRVWIYTSWVSETCKCFQLALLSNKRPNNVFKHDFLWARSRSVQLIPLPISPKFMVGSALLWFNIMDHYAQDLVLACNLVFDSLSQNFKHEKFIFIWKIKCWNGQNLGVPICNQNLSTQRL